MEDPILLGVDAEGGRGTIVLGFDLGEPVLLIDVPVTGRFRSSCSGGSSRSAAMFALTSPVMLMPTIMSWAPMTCPATDSGTDPP